MIDTLVITGITVLVFAISFIAIDTYYYLTRKWGENE